jgi:Tfp pilus assembly protein PilF
MAAMASSDTCKMCGGPLTAGRCLRCESQWQYRYVHREIVILAVLMAVTVATFVVTRRFASSNETLRLQDGRAWYTQGQRALEGAHVETALVALRRAVAKDPNDVTYRLALAHALIAAHEDETARQLLLELRDQQPEDSETNLLLARIEARRGDRTAVGRYYQTAIVGLWPAEQRPAQRRVRTEFIEFLLDHGERDRALSELLVLEASLPDDGPSQRTAGRMLLAAGDARRAAAHFSQALRLDPNDQIARAGAAEASFELNDYAHARQYLDALEEDTDRSKELRTMTDLVLSNDPLAPRLPIGERRRRLAADLAQMTRRLDACQARTPAERRQAGVDLQPLLTEALGLDTTLNARNRPSSSDQIEAGFDVVVRGERLADRACGSPDPLDRAILLIARRHGAEGQ